jgi:hypothetical protein
VNSQWAKDTLGHPSDDQEELCNHNWDMRKMEGWERNAADSHPDDQGWSSSYHRNPSTGAIDLVLVDPVGTRDSTMKRQ